MEGFDSNFPGEEWSRRKPRDPSLPGIGTIVPEMGMTRQREMSPPVPGVSPEPEPRDPALPPRRKPPTPTPPPYAPTAGRGTQGEQGATPGNRKPAQTLGEGTAEARTSRGATALNACFSGHQRPRVLEELEIPRQCPSQPLERRRIDAARRVVPTPAPRLERRQQPRQGRSPCIATHQRHTPSVSA